MDPTSTQRPEISARPGIAGVNHAAQVGVRRGVFVARNLEHRQFARFTVKRRLGPGGIVRGADIHPSRRKILAGHLRVMAGGASPLERISQADRVDVRGIPQPELPEHEDVVPTRNRGAKLGLCDSGAASSKCRTTERPDRSRYRQELRDDAPPWRAGRAPVGRPLPPGCPLCYRKSAPRKSGFRNRQCARARASGNGPGFSPCWSAAFRACDRRLGSRASAMKFMLTGFPVSGSTSASPPSFSANCGVGLVTYFKFAAMRGRRNTDTAGVAL